MVATHQNQISLVVFGEDVVLSGLHLSLVASESDALPASLDGGA